MWIRNGMVMFHKMINYKGPQGRDIMQGCDIATLQLAAMAIGFPQLVVICRHRFELDELLTGPVLITNLPDLDALRPMLGMQEELMLLFLHLFTCRFTSGVSCATEEEGWRYTTIQALGTGPKGFTALSKSFPPSDRRDPHLSEVVKNVADFHDNQKTYELKAEYLCLCDPFHVDRLPAADSSACLEYLTKRLGTNDYQAPPPLPRWTEPLRDMSTFPYCDRLLRLVFTILARACGGVKNGQFANSKTLHVLVTERVVGIIFQLLIMTLVEDVGTRLESWGGIAELIVVCFFFFKLKKKH